MLAVFQAVAYAIAKPLGALVLGGVILWQVAAHVGHTNGRAIVHVPAAPVDVAVDDDVFHPKTLYETPIVCELRPGRHTVRLLRDGRVIYREEIRILAGEDLVLGTYDQSGDGHDPAQGD